MLVHGLTKIGERNVVPNDDDGSLDRLMRHADSRKMLGYAQALRSGVDYTPHTDSLPVRNDRSGAVNEAITSP